MTVKILHAQIVIVVEICLIFKIFGSLIFWFPEALEGPQDFRKVWEAEKKQSINFRQKRFEGLQAMAKK